MSSRLSQSLPTVSLAISIAAIICMAITFAVLFFLYARAKSKGIAFGTDDSELKTDILKKAEKAAKRKNPESLKSSKSSKNSKSSKSCEKSDIDEADAEESTEVAETVIAEDPRHKGSAYSEALVARRKKERVVRIIVDVILAALTAVVGAAAIFSFVLRSKGEQIFLGGTAYLTVLTSSMEEKNVNNVYLREHDDGVRIDRYALIGIDKTEPENIKEGDIIAFRYDDETVYVHRVVAVREENGERLFTTMGDANSTSAANETDIAAKRIIGVYNGYNSEFLGVILIYMRSDIGIIALIFVLLLLAAVDCAEWIVAKSYDRRQTFLAAEMDGGDATDVFYD